MPGVHYDFGDISRIAAISKKQAVRLQDISEIQMRAPVKTGP